MNRLLVSLVLLTAACGQSQTHDAPQESISLDIEQVKAALDPKRSELEAVHGKLMKAVEAAKQHPPLGPIASPPVDASTILLADEAQAKYDPNGLWCGPAEGYAGTVFRQMKEPYAVRRNQFEFDQKGIPTALGAKQALVCRTTRLDPLVLDQNAKSFTGGYFEGECRLFELEGAKYLGGIALAQGLSEKLSSRGNPTASTFSADLGTAVSEALNRAMWGTQLPQSRLAYGCNFPSK